MIVVSNVKAETEEDFFGHKNLIFTINQNSEQFIVFINDEFLKWEKFMIPKENIHNFTLVTFSKDCFYLYIESDGYWPFRKSGLRRFFRDIINGPPVETLPFGLFPSGVISKESLLTFLKDADYRVTLLSWKQKFLRL